MSYSKQINFYKVIQNGFVSPLAESPSNKSLKLKKGDVLIVLDGDESSHAYIRRTHGRTGESHTQLNLRKDFLDLNKKIFTPVSLNSWAFRLFGVVW